jgi:anaphase-promoting complex subunit 10
MRVQEVVLYIDFKLDESYTPAEISVRAGTGFHDLQEVQVVSPVEPTGWLTVPLDRGGPNEDQPLRAHLLQLAILSSHQNGRDTHVRQVKVYGPRESVAKGLGMQLGRFTTIDFHQFSEVR